MQLLRSVTHGLQSASKHGRLSAGQLAQILRVDPSSLTGVLRCGQTTQREPCRYDGGSCREGAGVLPSAQVVGARSVLKAVAAALDESD